MLEIVMYSISYSPTVISELPYSEYFIERGLCHLADLRDPDVRLILITAMPVNRAVLEYHLRDLYSLNSDERSRLLLFTPKRENGCASLAELVASDILLVKKLKAEVAKDKDAAMMFIFSADPTIEWLADQLGSRPSERPYRQARYWGSKAGSKEAFRQAGVASPHGPSECFWSVDEVKQAAVQIISDNPSASKIVIKLNDASWGDSIGNTVIDSGRLKKSDSLPLSVSFMFQPWESFEREISKYGAIVEEFAEGSVCSPSGQGYIGDDGEVSVTAAHEQIVVSGQYLGCSFPVRCDFRKKVVDAVVRVGRKLSSAGLRGAFGIDFIGLENGELLAVEINARKVATNHVILYVESVVGGRVNEDGQLTVGGRPVCYVHRRFYAPELLGKPCLEHTITTLREQGILYNSDSKSGVLLHILGALDSHRYIELTYISGDLLSANVGIDEAEAALRLILQAQ